MSTTAALLQTRDFVLTAFRTLPNVLFVTALLLGALTGFAPLTWLGLGLAANAAAVRALQGGLAWLFPQWDQVHAVRSEACSMLPRLRLDAEDPYASLYAVIAPSQYVAAVVFFAGYIIYDAQRVMKKPARADADPAKVDRRLAVTLGATAVTSIFLFAATLRLRSGCESFVGTVTGAGWGAAFAVAWWTFMNWCHNSSGGVGEMPDVLQVVTAMAPPGRAGVASDAPVVCKPMP